MNLSTWLIKRQKTIIYTIYAVLAICSLVLCLPQVQILVINISELIPFLVLGLVGLIQFENDQSKNFKLWFMLNFTFSFLALFIASKTNLVYNSFDFNSLFRIHFLNVPLIFIFSWLNLVLAVIVFGKSLHLKSERIRNIYTFSLLFLISVLITVALDKMRLILVDDLFGSPLSVLVWVFISAFGVYSFDFLKLEKPKDLIMHSSIFQLVILFWFYFFKSI